MKTDTNSKKLSHVFINFFKAGNISLKILWTSIKFYEVGKNHAAKHNKERRLYNKIKIKLTKKIKTFNH